MNEECAVRSIESQATSGATSRPSPLVAGFFNERTSSVQYVVTDPGTKCCALIDPVLDFDETTGTTATHSADALLDYVRRNGCTIEWILDTHPHADHLSAAGYLHRTTGSPTAIGDRIKDVQKLWREIYNLPECFPVDGSQWDKLLSDGERFRVGDLDVEVFHSPGHTLASVTYLIGDAAFVHDTVFMPDFGTARCDFPGGDARSLWRSIQRILALPDETRLFAGHDYRPGGREPAWESSVAGQKAGNVHLKEARSEAEFVSLRTARDAKLPVPELMLHALQVNIAGGRLPAPEANGKRYLKIPLDALSNAAWR
ncbi:MBL fold metallo-hydrolase [Aurantimonas coralicida]|jgi:glyoxylase-like metal-dependent hydrolase (beta-lactamase superfamily II)|uniref:MBL fold metallo-hydrolase n=1 Tax=Aurantimonas coralicida TaxID=182270 RepID=UPI001D190AB3|nr:MBL fold metallo-hydrolase [Aurantimonas coralicida]MCC4300108.1 MBL fold metallo-hydrolase [Aurantimonas coralicida]